MVEAAIAPSLVNTTTSCRLHLLRVDTNTLIDLCIENDDIASARWSPEGHYLAAIESVAQQKALIIFDALENRLISLPSIQPLDLVGWFSSP